MGPRERGKPAHLPDGLVSDIYGSDGLDNRVFPGAHEANQRPQQCAQQQGQGLSNSTVFSVLLSIECPQALTGH